MTKRFPFPSYPRGWFAVAFAHEVKPGAVVARRAFGEDLVVFRTEGGAMSVLDAYCPHLGAHFAHGGKVVGETLQCGFHGFCFDATGACVSTPYATKIPPKVHARSWEVRERNGFVLVWYDPLGGRASWEVPEMPQDGWTEQKTETLAFKSHPQETSENSVDIGHFGTVHGYTNPAMVRDLKIDGPLLTIAYKSTRPLDNVGMPGMSVDFTYDVEVHGLGYSFVGVDVHTFGVKSRQYVCATPTDLGEMELRLGSQQTKMPDPAMSEQIADLTFRGFLNDVKQDVPIWESKRYLMRPALAEGDGPVGAYRKWCKQFYVEGVEDARAAE